MESLLNTLDSNSKRLIRIRETHKILARAQTMLKIGNKNNHFIKVKNKSYCEEIFEQEIWTNYLPILSMVIQETN